MMWVSLADGRKLGVPLAHFPRLLAITPKKLKNYELSGGAPASTDELDEDISAEGLLMGVGNGTRGNRVAIYKRLDRDGALALHDRTCKPCGCESRFRSVSDLSSTSITFRTTALSFLAPRNRLIW